MGEFNGNGNYIQKKNMTGYGIKGVDNWQGYRLPPDRADYDTDEEYQEAVETAILLENYVKKIHSPET